MSEDRWRDGYQNARAFYRGQIALASKVLVAWGDPERDDVRALVRKHWPELAGALDALQEVP